MASSCEEHALPLRQIIFSGDKAFYKQADYIEATHIDLEQTEPLPPSGIYDDRPTTWRVAREVFSYLSYPLDYLHTAYGNRFFRPSASAIIAKEARPRIDLSSEWKYRRFSLLVNGTLVDAILMGRPSTFDNGRWMLSALGITKVYECQLIANPEQVFPHHKSWVPSLQRLLTETNSNAVIYNYPGMGASAGSLSRKAMIKAHTAFLQFVENQLHARAIIDRGHSFGGGVQAEAWRTHRVRKGTSYVLVKDRTFVHSSDAVTNIAGRFLGIAGTLLGWDIHTIPSSDALTIPEIHVMCVKNIDRPRRFTDLSEIALSGSDSSFPTYNDRVVPAYTSSAIHYLGNTTIAGQKIIIGVPDLHGDSIEDPTVLAEAINQALRAQEG